MPDLCRRYLCIELLVRYWQLVQLVPRGPQLWPEVEMLFFYQKGMENCGWHVILATSDQLDTITTSYQKLCYNFVWNLTLIKSQSIYTELVFFCQALVDILFSKDYNLTLCES